MFSQVKFISSLSFRKQFKKIVNICSKNLKSDIKDVMFLSSEGSIQLIYEGHIDGDHFTVKYQVKNSKQLLTQENCTRYTYIYVIMHCHSILIMMSRSDVQCSETHVSRLNIYMYIYRYIISICIQYCFALCGLISAEQTIVIEPYLRNKQVCNKAI